MRQVVIGAGEVGRALGKVLGCDVVDITGHTGFAAVLHIAFPWSETFEIDVRRYRDAYQPSLVIVHSTVPVGTCDALGTSVVHSPVTGRHPNLEQSIRGFIKWFGGPSAEAAAGLFRQCGIRTRTVPSARITEAGKLWQTLQFGLLVVIEKEVHRYATMHGLDPRLIYDEMNSTYNEGYAVVGEPFRLPILEHMPGRIGGHCIVPNAELLDTPLADVLLDFDRDAGAEGW